MSLTDSTPVLRVADYPRARAFWEGVLGFEVKEEGGDPPGFGIYRSGGAQIFLMAYDGAEAPYDGWRAYIHTDDLQAVAARLDAAGHPYAGPDLREYGMREITLQDPDGNGICFGQDAA